MEVSNLQAKQLREAKQEHEEITKQINVLRAKQREVAARIERLKDASGQSNSLRGREFYDNDNFSWCGQMMETCKEIFKIKTFRSLQRPAINASMSGVDCLLIMPTGGGKSLTFQLPAVLSKGITIVVSPLISLMEDQVMSLQRLDIETALFNAQTTGPESRQILRDMVDPNSSLKLIYVTPEKLAKSKSIMSQMEKMYSLGRFARLVIDEVHCCSQWGHDFRKDYKFLGIMKNQFPDVPILGLTATATPEVILDIQKILNIEGCLVLKDSFYRPNLKYEIIKSTNKDDSPKIAEMVRTRFRGQSGIVYCLTVKETENLAKELQKFNLRASAYHAKLSPELRSKIHEKWYSGVIQVIVATIAFGMGINKMDVRFVIHYSMSKSIENYYQETGRAGRDGQEAYCILLYRFQDSFRVTSLFFTENNALRTIYQMIGFCTNREDCRKKLLAQYFGDNDCECNKMCDNCINNLRTERLDVTRYCENILSILKSPKNSKERFTALKLLEAWTGKGGATKLRVDEVPKPLHPREVCESIIIQLLINGYLKEDFHFTPYSTISYLVPGYKAALVRQEPLVIRIATVASPGDSLTKSRSRLPSKESNDTSTALKYDTESSEESDNDEIIVTSAKKRPRILDDSVIKSEDEEEVSDNSLICLD